MRKISDVKGIRGVKKLFQEIAQTVSKGKHDSELIGSAQITLKVDTRMPEVVMSQFNILTVIFQHFQNIPATGQMAWFKLQKKSRNVSKGMILLKMVFGSEKDENVALEEHRYLVKTLLQHQMKQEGVRTRVIYVHFK